LFFFHFEEKDSSTSDPEREKEKEDWIGLETEKPCGPSLPPLEEEHKTRQALPTWLYDVMVIFESVTSLVG